MQPAGELRDRVTFEERIIESDEMGGTQGTFSEQFTIAARIRYRFGGEQVMAARLAGRQPAIITVRQSSDTLRITTDWRARDIRTGDIFNVRSVADPDGKRHDLDLLCEKGVDT